MKGIFRTRTAVLAGSLMLAFSVAVPEAAHASIWGKIKKTAKKVAHKAEKTADSVADKAEDIGKDIGDTVIDEGVDIGKEIKKEGNKSVLEVKEKGKVVGHVIVENGKIVATEAVENGKTMARVAETGPKYLVKGGEIVGQEALHNGKVIGNSVIKNGKVVGYAVQEGGEYVVKQGRIALKYISAQACKLLVSTVKDVKKVGSALPDFDGWLDDVKRATHAKQAEMAMKKTGASLKNAVINNIRPLADVMPEMARIGGVIKADSSKIEALFTSSSLCDSSPKDLEAKLVALNLKPTLSGKFASPGRGFFISEANAAAKGFYMAYGLQSSVAYYGGVSTALTVATNYKGDTGVFFSVGPQIGGSAGAGAGIGLQFYPSVDLGGFEGMGLGMAMGFEADLGKLKEVGMGVDLAFTEKMAWQGFGVSVSKGKEFPAKYKLPIDANASFSYSWKLK